MLEIVKDKMPIAWTLKNPEDAKHLTSWDYAKITKKKAVFIISLKKFGCLGLIFLPLALLAKGQGKWVVTYQREVAE